MLKVSVIGAGSWGTALAVNLARNNHEVTIWSIMEDEIKMLQEHREHLDFVFHNRPNHHFMIVSCKVYCKGCTPATCSNNSYFSHSFLISAF